MYNIWMAVNVSYDGNLKVADGSVDIKAYPGISFEGHVEVKHDMVFAASGQLPGDRGRQSAQQISPLASKLTTHAFVQHSPLQWPPDPVGPGASEPPCPSLINMMRLFLQLVVTPYAEVEMSLHTTDGPAQVDERQAEGERNGLRLTAEGRLVCGVVAADAGAALALAEARAASGTCRR